MLVMQLKISCMKRTIGKISLKRKDEKEMILNGRFITYFKEKGNAIMDI